MKTKRSPNLIPVSNHTIQPTSDDLTRLLRMPVKTSRRTAFLTAGHNFVVHFPGLPVPKAYVSGTVAGADKLAIWRYLEVNGVTSVVVAAEALLSVLAEFVRGAVDDDLIVAGLEGDVFAVWMGCCPCEGEHVWFCDEFNRDGNAIFPGAEGFVVRCGDKATVFVNKRDGIDCCQVVVVLLNQFAGAGIELNDLLVGHTSQELVGVLCTRVESNDVWRLAGRETTKALAILGVPEFDLAVVGCCEECFPGGMEICVGDSFGVARESAQKLARMECIPDLCLAVRCRR